MHASLEHRRPSKLARSQTMQCVAFQSELHSASDDGALSNVTSRPAGSSLMKHSENAVGPHSRPRSAPAVCTSRQHTASQHHVQSRASSIWGRFGLGSADGRDEQRQRWRRRLCGLFQSPAHTRRAALRQRETAQMHLHGGSYDAARRVVTAAVEAILRDHACAFAGGVYVGNAQHAGHGSAPADGSYLRRARNGRVAIAAAARKRKAARRKLLHCMYAMHAKVKKMTDEAQSLATAAMDASQEQDRQEASRMLRAIEQYLQHAGKAGAPPLMLNPAIKCCNAQNRLI
jgi:hypothetical protein